MSVVHCWPVSVLLAARAPKRGRDCVMIPLTRTKPVASDHNLVRGVVESVVSVAHSSFEEVQVEWRVSVADEEEGETSGKQVAVIVLVCRLFGHNHPLWAAAGCTPNEVQRAGCTESAVEGSTADLALTAGWQPARVEHSQESERGAH
jgi:hypothetical protein